MRFLFGIILSVWFLNSSFSQKVNFTSTSIPEALKENANSVVREQKVDIIIQSISEMNVKTKKVITVFNEKGLNNIDAVEYYDKSNKINSVEAIVYNAFGIEIKKLKRKDFFDQSVAEGFEISEGRILTLRYTPTEYPFTIVYQSEVTSANTAFIPQWFPINDYYESVEKAEINIIYPPDLGFKYKELNFENRDIEKKESDGSIAFHANNLPAEKSEDYATSFQKNVPKVIFALDKFMLEGVEGTSKSWKDFGIWMNDYLIKGADELSIETQNRVKELVGSETDPIKKAKIIYQYMQDKTRYVSIQLGIGGWKPMKAKDVDRLGYGDCKALTNYTKALLKVAEVESYYTIIYGSNQIKNIIPDFVSMQGNHVILMLPINDEYKLLECTSQTQPFGFESNFTDDRLALIVKPNGGEIVRTKVYSDSDNSQISKGNYSLLEDGTLLGSITIVSQGSRYGRKFGVEKMSPENKEAYYKECWDNINNLKIKKNAFSNDKGKVAFTEKVEISAINYGNISGNKIFFIANVFNKYTGNVKRIKNRKYAFEIQRGYYDTDEIEIILPTRYSIEFLPPTYELNSKFGEYKVEIIKKENNTITYKRTMLLKKGIYSNIDYDEYRLFMDQIVRNDDAKIILNKN